MLFQNTQVAPISLPLRRKSSIHSKPHIANCIHGECEENIYIHGSLKHIEAGFIVVESTTTCDSGIFLIDLCDIPNGWYSSYVKDSKMMVQVSLPKSIFQKEICNGKTRSYYKIVLRFQ